MSGERPRDGADAGRPGTGATSIPDAETLSRYLQRLDGEEFAAFLAALWEARGWTATREDGTVRVTDGTTVRTLRPVPGRRLPSGDDIASGGGTDAVVAAGVLTDDERAAGAGAADVLDAGDLRRMLAFALDRDAAVALCERHLGTAPAAMRPPLRRRTDAWLSRLPTAGTVLSVALVLVAVGGVAWLFTAGGSLTGDQPAPAPVGTPPGDGSTTTPGDTPRTDRGPAVDPPVPGLSEAGVTDLDALASSHRELLTDRRYRRSSSYRGPDPRNRTAGFVVRTVDVETDGTRWRRKLTTIWGERERRVRETYFDGNAGYVASYNGDGFTYQPAGADTDGEVVLLDPAATSDRVVRQYLSVERTNVTGVVEDDGQVLYRVAGTGDPAADALDGVQNYSVVALLHEEGYVAGLQANYTVETPKGTREVTFGISYELTDQGPVEPPTWYERRWGGDPGTEGTTVRAGGTSTVDGNSTGDTDGSTTPTG